MMGTSDYDASSPASIGPEEAMAKKPDKIEDLTIIRPGRAKLSREESLKRIRA
jgi:hypothetical protein